MRFTAAFFFGLSLTNAWVIPNRRIVRSSCPLHMALDYNDPAVAEELAGVQTMTFEEIEEELLQSGLRASASMPDMELRLMLVEVRMRMSGKLKAEKKKKPTSFSSKFQEALYTKPAFEELYNKYSDKGDHNSMNVIAEFANNPDIAEKRYGKDYRGVIREAKEALTAPPPVKSPTLEFSGFPANMGEAGCKMTLEAVGTIVDFECSESEELPILTGKVTFEDIETAKKAVEQYNGMDMGMGTELELASV
mmetsp:Transcript_28967/g.43751  ORF Transcript_28967/g.43751 Transcript_28967/m.43751 type:complete len:250 (+) Transcript_28967:125-874(+)